MKTSEIINSIQSDILDPTVSISVILFKAKVLAHYLKNDRFKNWVRYELDGYPNDSEELPDYRIMAVQSVGNIVNRTSSTTGIVLGLGQTPKWLQEAAGQIKFDQGIGTVEEIAKQNGTIRFPWPAEWIRAWEKSVNTSPFQQLLVADRLVPSAAFAQIAQIVRSRLQDFVLELSDLPWDMSKQPVPVEQVENLVSVAIFNNQEAIVPTFDQRGQQVQSQNNAARDINIAGNISNKQELIYSVSELRSLLDQVEMPEQRAKVETAIALLETSVQEESVSKGEIVEAVETVAQVAPMREALEKIATGVASGVSSALIVAAIKFALNIP